MARFLEGAYQGSKIRALPADWREKYPWFYKRWILPYIAGTILKFGLEITEQAVGRGEIYLLHMDIKVHWPGTGHTTEYTSIDRYSTKKNGSFGEYSVPYSGVIEIWAGAPYRGGSALLVQAEAIDVTTILISVITSVVTTGVLGLLALLSTLIFGN